MAAFVFLSGVGVLASISDIKTRKIPNWLTYPTLLVSIIWLDTQYLIHSLLALTLVIFGSEYIGAGDIKLALVFTLWSYHYGWSGWWFLFACAAASVVMIQNGLTRKIPFAPYMTVGFLTANLILPLFTR